MSEQTAEPYVPLPADRAPEPKICPWCGNNASCEARPFAWECGRLVCRDCGKEITDNEGGY